MKKRVFLLITALFIGSLVSAQVKTSINICPQFNENFGFRIGSDLDIPLNYNWSFVPGAYWSLRNRIETRNTTTNNVETNIKYKDEAHFITMPLRFGLQIHCKDDDRFTVKLLFGPYLAYGLSGNSKSITQENGIKKTSEVGAFEKDGRYNHRFDYGLNLGLNALINQSLQLGFFGEVGFRNIYNQNGWIEDLITHLFLITNKNFALGLTLGYQF